MNLNKLDYYSRCKINADINDKEAFCSSYNFHNVSRCLYRDDYEKASSQLVHVETLKHVFYVVPSVTFGISVFKSEQRSGNHVKFFVWQRDR